MRALRILIMAIAFGPFVTDGALASAHRYYNLVFQGDLSSARAELDAEPDQEVRARLLEKFDARFIEKTDGLDVDAIDDRFVRGVADLYQDYWRRTLLDPGRREIQEDELLGSLARLLNDSRGGDEAIARDDVMDRVKEEIEARGFHAILGRTPPLLEFMVWQRVEDREYAVTLTDGVQDVAVHFMTDFISRGWAHFATFGRSSAGGWATPEGLYAVKESYDLESEKFLVSYLKHEARHFADYSLYPELPSADLEYRAKLTEIIFADQTRGRLLEHFTRSAARRADAPHSLASWHLVRNLSGLLRDNVEIPDPAVWADVPADQVQQAARQLLTDHDAALAALDPSEAQGIIRP